MPVVKEERQFIRATGLEGWPGLWL